MATRNIVPRATGEGSIGTPEKTWGSINAEGINVYSERTAPVNTLQRETAYVVDDIVYSSKLNAKYYLLCITAGTTASVEPSFSDAVSNTQITDGTVVWRVQTVTSQEKAAGVPVGFEYFQMNPNVPEGSLPLLGGVYSRDTYKDLWEWVQLQGGYLKTEAEWQTLSASNNGNVPYYSDGDGSTTFRVPSLKCWIKGANGTVTEVGSYLAAGLPNITGYAQVDPFTSNAAAEIRSFGGALYGDSLSEHLGQVQSTSAGSGFYNLRIDASRSSSVYGNSATVQPPSIVGMWLVKAYGVIVDTGTIDEQAYIDDRFNASKQYTDDKVAPIGTVVEDSFISAVTYTNGAHGALQISLPKGTWVITGHLSFTSLTANNAYGVCINDSVAYYHTNDGSVAAQSVATNQGLSSQTTKIMELSETKTIYLVAWSSVNFGVNGARIKAVRII